MTDSLSFCNLTCFEVHMNIKGPGFKLFHYFSTNIRSIYPNVAQLLQLLGDTFDALVLAQYRLEDLEVDALLPTLLEKSGQAKERFRIAIRGLLAKVPLLCSYSKYSPLLLQVSCHRVTVRGGLMPVVAAATLLP